MILIDLAENVVAKRTNHRLSSLIFWVICGHYIRSDISYSFILRKCCEFCFKFNVELSLIQVMDTLGVLLFFFFPIQSGVCLTNPDNRHTHVARIEWIKHNTLRTPKIFSLYLML